MSSVAATSLKPLVFFATLIVLSGSSLVDADVPKPENIAACNNEPQDPDGAKDPAYQATYRTCMRKVGF